jgi:hypothetical protein
MPEIARLVRHITTESGGYLTIDTTYAPIIKVWWFGVVSPELIDSFWAFRDEVLIDRMPCVILIHHIEDADPVEATSRKYLAEKGKNDPRVQRGEFLSIIVVVSAILRGVMTAVQWMAGDKFPLEFVPNMEQAFKVARKLLEKREYLDLPPTFDTTAFAVTRNPGVWPKQS